MTDLTEWLLEQIAEDERVARAAAGERTSGWVAVEYEYDGISVRDDTVDPDVPFRGDPGWRDSDVFYTDETVHISRWDPARVLAECDAKRRVIALTERANEIDYEYRAQMGFAQQGQEDFWILKPGEGIDNWVGEDILRVLALPYADREGYDEAWRPVGDDARHEAAVAAHRAEAALGPRRPGDPA